MDVTGTRTGWIAVAAFVTLLVFGSPSPASACSCKWEGPFLQVAPSAELIIRAKILAHPPVLGKTPQPMEVQVVEVLRGEVISAERERTEAKFTGDVRAGERFEKPFAGRFRFILEPIPTGWTIVVREQGRDEDLSRLTPPFHGAPNPRDIEGWHFRNADNTGPNEAGEKNVNAPGEVREFIFSPEVGKTIDRPDAGRSPTPEEVEAVRRFGQGTLTIRDYRLSDVEPGRQARFEWMKFEVQVGWAHSW
jgi:hypothetical protein